MYKNMDEKEYSTTRHGLVLKTTNAFHEFHIFRGLFRSFWAAFPSTNKNSLDKSASKHK